MSDTHLHQPPHPNQDVPEKHAPGRLPVEPDEGPIPPLIPPDPEHERDVDPGAIPAQMVTRTAWPTRGSLMPARLRKGRPIGRQPPMPPRFTKAPHSPADLPLPHERDESTDPTADAAATPVASDGAMAQAKRDIDAGQVDADMRATPGLSAERRARLVPGPGGKPPASDD